MTETQAPVASIPAPVVSTPAPIVSTPAPVTAAPNNNQQSSEQLDQLRQILANIRPAGKSLLKKKVACECLRYFN